MPIEEWIFACGLCLGRLDGHIERSDDEAAKPISTDLVMTEAVFVCPWCKGQVKMDLPGRLLMVTARIGPNSVQ